MDKLIRERRRYRFWFYRPALYWTGISPIRKGHDEYARHTIVLGYPFTGSIVIPFRNCTDEECIAEAIQLIDEFEE